MCVCVYMCVYVCVYVSYFCLVSSWRLATPMLSQIERQNIRNPPRKVRRTHTKKNKKLNADGNTKIGLFSEYKPHTLRNKKKKKKKKKKRTSFLLCTFFPFFLLSIINRDHKKVVCAIIKMGCQIRAGYVEIDDR